MEQAMTYLRLSVVSPPLENEAKQRLTAYLRSMGLQDGLELEQLIEECLHQTRLKVSNQAGEEFCRRAIEAAKRRYEQWLIQAVQLKKTPPPQGLARVQTSLQANLTRLGGKLRFGEPLSPEQIETLRSGCPQATPQETPLDMPVQKLKFFSLLPR
jgi:hypothetical protein